MATVKDQVIEVLSRLPDDCTLDDVMYQLYVRERVQKGLEAIDTGDTLSHEEAKAKLMPRIEKWRALSGPNPPSQTSK